MNNIPEFSVTEISNLTKNILEDNFGLIKVRGEISSLKNFKGHLYFSIKDESNILNAICWASKVPYLQVLPEDGIEVIAEGKISSYSKGSISSYQLQINQIEIKGEGALLKLFEQRKKKLEAEGLFHLKYKKKLPFFPRRIGIITSPTGAVIMDIIDRIQSRCPTQIKLYPVSVQGVNAAKEIINGLHYFEKYTVDVIIIARGGGGVEDFIPFNDESLIREVFNYKIPVVSAIGHETDFTLLDFVSDLRAATPTAAAELIVPELVYLKEKLNFLKKNIKQNILYFVKDAFKKFSNIHSVINFKKFKKLISDHKSYINNFEKLINVSFKSFLKLKNTELVGINTILNSLNIDNTLKRGYVLLKNDENYFIKSSKKLTSNSSLKIQFYDKEVKVMVKKNEGS